jgi:SAM-dependent methyltransferase
MNQTEKQFVYDTYNKIAPSFSRTRTYVWPSVKKFLDRISKNSIILEVGCGNGKNLNYRTDCFNIGVDLCPEFCKITGERNIETFVVNNNCLSLKDNSVDIVLSIAVIHHLSTDLGRKQSMKELVRVLGVGGKAMIQVWALKQPKNSRRRFVEGDNLVDFKSKDGSVDEKRYYYIFTELAFRNLLGDIENIKIEDIYWEYGNWIAIIEKIA